MTAAPQHPASEPDLEHLRRLAEVGRAFTYTTSLEQVAELVVAEGAALLDASAAVLMLPDDDELLHIRAAFGVDAARVTRFSAPLGDELIARLQGLLAVDGSAFVAVPLVVGGAVSGLLAVSLSRAATDADEWLLSALADQAAVALENARLGGAVRLRMEDRLRVSEGATDAKDRALSTLAHDIRTPLGAIKGYCELMEDEVYGPISEKQREALVRIRMSGRHLLSLFDNVMDLARFNAGNVQVKSEPVRLADVARESVHMLMPASSAKLQTLTLDATSDPMVLGDAARIRQVLVNLLGNAVKFTPQHGTIGVATRMHVVNGVFWGEVRVTDTGPGIATAEQSAIFEPYYRSEGTALLPGIGLGLAISSALVKQLGGQMELESALGEGSTFAIRFPVCRELAD